ncbi:aldehyde dehydrogenase family protein [Cuniculiplasma divulgatum]|uniref:NAD-dependent aldehyde dehydrogenase n=1 Tax=Cuniculiplasma divulgatum TaxID=1673428 RepID=A0A1R4A5M0_9ARCH|nr:aldehyde dehydrogenase family protein [Cuniculiplasma divulgatum]SJK84229.1 NAD-dependent aldehyde dehydrogenase [Cuniculiplasma divulgatum]
MSIETVNPYSMSKLGKYEEDDEDTVKKTFEGVNREQETWKKSIDDRIKFLKDEVIPRFKREKESLATIMSSEMGKPITQSRAEIDKCIMMTEYFCKEGKNFLSDNVIETEASKSFVRFEPLGTVFLVMPWNFPLWQAMRAAIPAMVAGNGIVLKHASIVTGSAKKMEEIFNSPLFRVIKVSGSRALSAIKYSDGVSFTGSEMAGMAIASEAGKHIKKSVLELGGSDPFVVLDDANLEQTAKESTYARLQNNGQSCIASKRFIVSKKISENFFELMKENFEKVRLGDQLDDKTFIGPLSSASQAETVRKQIEQLNSLGKLQMFGEQHGNIIPPTIVQTEANYLDEVFGPVAIFKTFDTLEDAAKICNETGFGLGASVWGSVDQAEKVIPMIRSGMVFVNKVVASDPRLPFGGVGKSGYGRELSKFGILEFTNFRTVWIQERP